MRTGPTHYCEGIFKGALQSSRPRLAESLRRLVDCVCEGAFCLEKYRAYPEAHLENFQNGKRELLRLIDERGFLTVMFAV